MTGIACSACLSALLLLSGAARREADRIRLKITYPPRDVVTRYTAVRVAGSCAPACRVSVAGKPVKVYPTGAFVAWVPLVKGENRIEICAEREGLSSTETLNVSCRDPIETSPVAPLTIDRPMLDPAADIVLQPGDDLRVRLKGSPGMRAFWSLGDVMRDAPLREDAPSAGGPLIGIAGIYVGSYRVREGDRVNKEPVMFRLVSGDGAEVEARSPGRVTLLPREKLRRGEAGPKGAVLSNEPGGERILALDAGTRLNICGEAGEYYRLKLSPTVRYWAPKKSVKAVRGKGGWDATRIGAPGLAATEEGARLFIPCSGAPAYLVTQDLEKKSWKLEIFGVEGLDEHEAPSKVPPIAAIALSLPKEDPFVVTLHMNDGRWWGFRCGMDAGELALNVRKPPGKEMREVTVVLDPGHGGSQDGAVSPTGLKEKDLNLKVSQAAAAALQGAGARVVLTRDDDRTLSLAQRIDIARRELADIFVSIHHNSRPGHCDPMGRRGADTFYGVQQSRPLAERILERLSAAGVRANGCEQKNFAVILPTGYLAVLVECAYMSHPEDEEMLLREGFSEKLGRAIADGVTGFVREAG